MWACRLETGPPSLEACTDRKNSSLAKARQMKSLVDSIVCSLLSAPIYTFLTLPAMNTHTAKTATHKATAAGHRVAWPREEPSQSLVPSQVGLAWQWNPAGTDVGAPAGGAQLVPIAQTGVRGGIHGTP